MTDIVEAKFYENLYFEIKNVLTVARNKAVVAVNTALVQAYWTVGKIIVNAQGGKQKAAYGNNLIDRLSERLTAELGKGFTRSNSRTIRQFYLIFPNCHSVSGELSWTHSMPLIAHENFKLLNE